MEIELFYDLSSNYSYPAVMTADQAATKRGIKLVHRPILLGPIFTAQGLSGPPFVQFKQKGQYAFRDCERICAELGIRWKVPTVFPRRSVLPARIALIGFDEGWGLQFVRGAFTLNYVEDREIDDEPNMRELLAELGQNADHVIAKALSKENKDRLRLQTERAQQIGVFGAPTFVVGQEIFWGHDRMRQAFDWAERPGLPA